MSSVLLGEYLYAINTNTLVYVNLSNELSEAHTPCNKPRSRGTILCRGRRALSHDRRGSLPFPILEAL